jgi:hypothetical protein
MQKSKGFVMLKQVARWFLKECDGLRNYVMIGLGSKE